MLTAPKRSIVASAAACNSRFSDTSALTPAISALLGFSASTAHASAASSMSQSMTLAPARASALAMPSPMPDAAPVTNATLPETSCMAALPNPPTFGKDYEAQKSAYSEVRRLWKHAAANESRRDTVAGNLLVRQSTPALPGPPASPVGHR